MTKTGLWSALLCLSLGIAPLHAGERPTVVELFTSEGCSSCPPAEQQLANAEKNQPYEGVEIIPLTRHHDDGGSMTELARLVDGTPKALAGFTMRQINFSAANRRRRKMAGGRFRPRRGRARAGRGAALPRRGAGRPRG